MNKEEQIKKLRLRVNQLRRVLEFYAFSRWNSGYPGGIPYEVDGKPHLDTGEKARKALRGT